MAGVMVYGSGDGRVVILPVTDLSGTETIRPQAYTYADAGYGLPTATATTTASSSMSHTETHTTTEYRGITGIRSVVETPYTIVATITTSIEGQTTVAPIPLTTVVQAGTVVIIQPDPPDEDRTTNLVAILAGTLGCAVGMVLVGLIIFLSRRARKRRQRRERLEEEKGGVTYPSHFDEPRPLAQPEMIIGDGLIATPFEFVPPVPEKDRSSTLISTPLERSSFAASTEAVGSAAHQYSSHQAGSWTHQDATRDSFRYSSQVHVDQSGIGTHTANPVLVHEDGGPVRTLSVNDRTVGGGIGHPPPYYGQ